MTEEQKIEFQQSLYTSKQFLKKIKKKMHFNGHLRKVHRDTKKVVVYLKVVEVLEDLNMDEER